MKYIKLFEYLIHGEKLILYQMYNCHTVIDEPICFLGNTGDQAIPLLFIIFNDNEMAVDFRQGVLSSVRWKSSLEFVPLNITIKDYIIQNNIVNKTLEFIQKRIQKLNSLSGRQNSNCRKLFNTLYETLLNDEEIMFHAELENNVDKYNL